MHDIECYLRFNVYIVMYDRCSVWLQREQVPLLEFNFMGHYESRGPHLLCPVNDTKLLKTF